MSKEPDVDSTKNDEFKSMLIAILVRPQVGSVLAISSERVQYADDIFQNRTLSIQCWVLLFFVEAPSAIAKDIMYPKGRHVAAGDAWYQMSSQSVKAMRACQSLSSLPELICR
jgi:hypothetical protein